MNYRLSTFDDSAFKMHVQKMLNTTSQLMEGGCNIPGSLAKDRSFWLYPILVENTQLWADYLDHVGVSARKGAT